MAVKLDLRHTFFILVYVCSLFPLRTASEVLEEEPKLKGHEIYIIHQDVHIVYIAVFEIKMLDKIRGYEKLLLVYILYCPFLNCHVLSW